MECRCGHGRATHRPTSNALAKRRARAYGAAQQPCRLACQYGVRPGGRKVCKCRDWHPEVNA